MIHANREQEIIDQIATELAVRLDDEIRIAINFTLNGDAWNKDMLDGRLIQGADAGTPEGWSQLYLDGKPLLQIGPIDLDISDKRCVRADQFIGRLWQATEPDEDEPEIVQ